MPDDFPEGLQGLRFRSCCKCVEELVLVLTLGEEGVGHYVHIVLEFLLSLALNLGHFTESLVGIRKSGLEFLCRLT